MTDKYETESGVRIGIQAVSPALLERVLLQKKAQMAANHEWPSVPQIKLTNVAGEVFEFDMTEDALEDPDDKRQTLINKLTWAKYQQALVDAQSVLDETEILLYLAYGTEAVVPDDGWEAGLAQWGVEIPSEPQEMRKAYWLFYIALTSYDLQMLLTEIRMRTLGRMVTREQLESFRSRITSMLAERAQGVIDGAISAIGSAGTVGGGEQVSGNEVGQSVAPSPQ